MTGRMTGRDSILDAVRAAVREEARALGLLGNGDRERLIRMEERHRTVDRRVAAIEGKIDALAGELKERDERAETRFVTRAEASDVLGDVRKVRWMIVAAVVAALLAITLQGKAAF
ncbi:MAG: hypothetical protein OXH64_09565 [Rhodospirillaceae bacterium]|nr:hypothetical protein [Rhodospirillaceae bacterium]